MFEKLIQDLYDLSGVEIIVGVQAEPGENFSGQTISSDDEMLMISKVHGGIITTGTG
jgi:hypothetical protein